MINQQFINVIKYQVIKTIPTKCVCQKRETRNWRPKTWIVLYGIKPCLPNQNGVKTELGICRYLVCLFVYLIILITWPIPTKFDNWGHADIPIIHYKSGWNRVTKPRLLHTANFYIPSNLSLYKYTSQTSKKITE